MVPHPQALEMVLENAREATEESIIQALKKEAIQAAAIDFATVLFFVYLIWKEYDLFAEFLLVYP